jgi:hypothetical protein
VVDSLAAAGMDRDELDRVVEQIKQSSGGGGGFGGGGAGGGGIVSTTWVERPAEARPTSGGVGRGGASELSLQQTITNLVRGEQGGGGRRGGGGGLFPSRSEPAPMAEPGTYTVIMKIGEQTFTQPLRVDRSHNAPSR